MSENVGGIDYDLLEDFDIDDLPESPEDMDYLRPGSYRAVSAMLVISYADDTGDSFDEEQELDPGLAEYLVQRIRN